MKRADRLRKPDQFQRARRDGRSWSTPLVALNAVGNKRRGTRCGFVVGKRVGKAVDRNRARRRLREAVRLTFDRIAPGWDLDRKSTRLNSSHVKISYAVFCLKIKKISAQQTQKCKNLLIATKAE